MAGGCGDALERSPQARMREPLAALVVRDEVLLDRRDGGAGPVAESRDGARDEGCGARGRRGRASMRGRARRHAFPRSNDPHSRARGTAPPRPCACPPPRTTAHPHSDTSEQPVRRGAAGARGIQRGGAPHAPRVVMLPAKGFVSVSSGGGKSDPFRGHPLVLSIKNKDLFGRKAAQAGLRCRGVLGGVECLYCPQDRAGTDVQTHRNATKAPLTGNRSTKPPPAAR